MVSKETKDSIRETFVKIYAKQGLQKMTVKEVCEQVPVSRTTFYAYYGDIYDILNEIIEELISTIQSFNTNFRYADLERTDPGEDYWRVEELLYYLRDNKEVIQALLNHSDAVFIHKWKKIIKDDFRSRYEYQSIYPDNMELTLEYIASALIGTYTYWVNHIDEASVEDILKLLADHIISDFI